MTSTGETYSLSWWLEWLPSAALFGFIIWRYIVAVRNRPCFNNNEIIYQEFFASGASRKNLFTKVGGARSCLRLVVARDFLWITSWFPFSLIAPLYDMEHVVPLRSITSVERDKFLGFESLIVNFVDARGRSHSVCVSPKKQQLFLHALGVEK
jgi:hypothetical protein